MDRLITADELAELWGISRASVYNQIRRGLPSVTIGKSRRFNPAKCERWLETQAKAS